MSQLVSIPSGSSPRARNMSRSIGAMRRVLRKETCEKHRLAVTEARWTTPPKVGTIQVTSSTIPATCCKENPPLKMQPLYFSSMRDPLRCGALANTFVQSLSATLVVSFVFGGVLNLWNPKRVVNMCATMVTGCNWAKVAASAIRAHLMLGTILANVNK